MKKKVVKGMTEDSVWQVTMTETKPIHKFECGACKRKITREKEAYAPWCVDCFDVMMNFLGLERMKDKGPIKQKPQKNAHFAWAQPGGAMMKTAKRTGK